MKKSNFDILAFYRGHTKVQDVLFIFTEDKNDIMHNFDDNAAREVSVMFREADQQAREALCRGGYTGKELVSDDHTAAFKIRFRSTGTVMYVGYEGSLYKLGLSVEHDKKDTTIIEFEYR